MEVLDAQFEMAKMWARVGDKVQLKLTRNLQLRVASRLCIHTHGARGMMKCILLQKG